MNVNEAFPSKYLKSEDLQGREIQLTIANVTTEKIGNDQKWVAYFVGKQKGVVINKTVAMVLAGAFGGEMNYWAGKNVILFSVWTEMGGKPVQGLRLRPAFDDPQRPSAPQSAPAPQPVGPPPGHPAGLNDDISDIPF